MGSLKCGHFACRDCLINALKAASPSLSISDAGLSCPRCAAVIEEAAYYSVVPKSTITKLQIVVKDRDFTCPICYGEVKESEGIKFNCCKAYIHKECQADSFEFAVS